MGWPEGRVAPAKLTADVVVSKLTTRPEPVSERLVRSIPHPDRSACLPIVSFAPDGRLVVAGYPSGVVQVLDPTTGRERRTIETPRGYRGLFDYMQMSKDGRLVFVGLGDSKFEPVHEGEKKSYFRRYSGEIRVYDLGSGAQGEPLKVEPRRGVLSIAVSPDGTKLATMEYSSGSAADFDKLRAIYLWDLATRQAVKLRDGYGDPRFSPDGRTLFVTVDDYQKNSGVMYAYSVAAGKEIGKLVSDAGPMGPFSFSPDGKLAALPMLDTTTKQPVVRLYDPVRLAPAGTLGAAGLEENSGFRQVIFSPDGKRIAAASGSIVYVWEVESRKLRRSWPLDTTGRVWHMAFAPESQRLAASTWLVPPELKGARDEVTTPEDFPQPKVFLIDLNIDKPHVLVCPHGWWGKPAFSPDGKLLAVGGAGAVHVFDVSTGHSLSERIRNRGK